MRYILIFIFLFFPAFKSLAKAEVINLNFASNEKLIEQEVAELLIQYIFVGTDVRLTVKPLPPLRANHSNLDKLIDGEIARIYEYGESFKELVRIEPPLYYLETVVYCKDPHKKFSKFEELNNSSISVVSGVAHSKIPTSIKSEIIYAKNAKQMYDLLLSNRVDYIIDTSINGNDIIKKNSFQNIYDCGKLRKLNLYTYLNMKSIKYKSFIQEQIESKVSKKEYVEILCDAEKKVLKSNKCLSE